MSRRPRALPTHWLRPFRLYFLTPLMFRGSGRNRSHRGTRTRIFYGIVMGLCMGLVMCRLYLPFSLPVYAWNRHARSMQVLRDLFPATLTRKCGSCLCSGDGDDLELGLFEQKQLPTPRKAVRQTKCKRKTEFRRKLMTALQALFFL
jgi:hypothetical protein